MLNIIENKLFNRYSSAVLSLLNYCKHYGFENEDEVVVKDYMDTCSYLKTALPESISKALNFNFTRSCLKLSLNINALLHIDRRDSLNKTLSDQLSESLLSKLKLHDCLNDNCRLTFNYSKVKVSILKFPFIPHEIVKVTGVLEIDTISIYSIAEAEVLLGEVETRTKTLSDIYREYEKSLILKNTNTEKNIFNKLQDLKITGVEIIIDSTDY